MLWIQWIQCSEVLVRISREMNQFLNIAGVTIIKALKSQTGLASMYFIHHYVLLTTTADSGNAQIKHNCECSAWNKILFPGFHQQAFQGHGI